MIVETVFDQVFTTSEKLTGVARRSRAQGEPKKNIAPDANNGHSCTVSKAEFEFG